MRRRVIQEVAMQRCIATTQDPIISIFLLTIEEVTMALLLPQRRQSRHDFFSAGLIVGFTDSSADNTEVQQERARTRGIDSKRR